MGLDAEIKLLPRATQFTEAGNPKTATYDLTIERWGADYADPYDFLNILLDGNQITNSQHNNYSYFNVAKYNKQMLAASLLVGPARGTAYAKLDEDLMADRPAVGPARQLERPDVPLQPRRVCRHQHRRTRPGRP